MNAIDATSWVGNWAWSLPMIVLTVVIHLCGLALMSERVVAVLHGTAEQRNFNPQIHRCHRRHILAGHRSPWKLRE